MKKNIRNRKIRTVAVLLLLMLSILAFDACTRRPLEEDYVETALIPVRIDWSISGVPVEGMHRASVWLFPVNGETPLEYRLEGNLTYREIPVPVGVYSVLVFNETIEENDWDAITFTGTERYETFAAMAVPDASRGAYFRSEEQPFIKNPDELAAWSLNRFEVTWAMVERTRTIARENSSYINLLENEVPDLTKVKPLPRFERIIITAYVTNLSSAFQSTGFIDGMAAGVYLVSGEMVSVPAVHAFILNGRVYEENGQDGTTTRAFNILGRLSGTATQHQVTIDFLLMDGTLHPRQEFEVTYQMNFLAVEGIVKTYPINLGYDLSDGDHPIELPDMDMGAGISVGEWDEVIIPIM